MKPLTIVAFFDGTPGHEKQTRGILAALAAITPIHVSKKEIPHPCFSAQVKDWMHYLVSFAIPRQQAEPDQSVDIIIGTGSQTHIPMFLYNKAYRAKIVTCMTPNFPLRRKMDLCFVPQHDGLNPGNNIVVTIGPPNTATFTGDHDINCGLILVGGLDKKSHTWNSDKTMAQIESIIKKEPAKKWTISSSPRTPEDMIRLLEKFASDSFNTEFFKSADTPDGWIEKEYAKNKTVWVTADSISMVYEALTAGCNVGILPVYWKKKNSKFQKSEAYLIQNRRVTPYDMWLASNQVTNEAPLDEAARCAREILQKWWPERSK